MLKSDLCFCHWKAEDKLAQFYTLSKSLIQLNTISKPSVEAHTHPHRQKKKTHGISYTIIKVSARLYLMALSF